MRIPALLERMPFYDVPSLGMLSNLYDRATGLENKTQVAEGLQILKLGSSRFLAVQQPTL